MDNRELELVVGDSPPQDEALGALRGLTRTCVRWRKARVKGSRKLVHRCAKYETGPKGRNRLPAYHGGVKRMPYGTRKSGRYPKAYQGMALGVRGKTLGIKARAQAGRRRKGVRKFGWKTTAAGRRCWNRQTNKAAPKAKCTTARKSTRKAGVRRTARRAYEPAAGRFRWKGRGKSRRCYDTKENQFAKKAKCNGRRKAAAGKRRAARKAAPAGKRRYVMRKGRCRDTVENVFASKTKCNGRRKAARGKRRSTRTAAPKRRAARGRYVMKTPKKGGRRYCWDTQEGLFASASKCKKAGAARKRSTAGPKRRTKRRSSRAGMSGAGVDVAVLGDAGFQYEIIDTKRGRRCREVGGRFAKMEMCNMANQDLSGLDAATEEFLADANPVAKTVPTKCKKFETIYSEALGRDVKVCADLAGVGAESSELNGLDIGAEDGALAGPLAKWYGFGVLGEDMPIGPLAGAAAAGVLAAVGVKVASKIPGLDKIPHGGLLLTGLVAGALTAMPRTRAFGIGALTGVATVAMFNIVGRLINNTAAEAYEGDLGEDWDMYGYDGLGYDDGDDDDDVQVLSDYGDEVQVLTAGFGDVGNMSAIVEEVDGYGFGEIVPEMDGFGEIVPEMDGFGEVVAEEDMYGLGQDEGVEILSSAFGSLPFAGAI